jgi:gamma-glutamyltranspeptidase/glutathione hydrolase
LEGVRWFDQWLKNRDTGILDEPRFAVYVRDWHPPGPYLEQAPGYWRWEDGWPIERSRERRVAMTTSVQGAFGSQLMVGGFILNNQLTDFDYVPMAAGKPVANRVEGGKRPLSSMSPTMVLDERGRLRLVVGSPGGTRIIGFVAQSIVGVLDWKLDVQQAVAAPHFLAEEGPIELEEGTALAAHEPALEALGHNVVLNGMNSGLHAIAIEYSRRSRVLYGGVDPRREGAALGD